MCFILASFSTPETIKSTWGRTADEISDEIWALLDGKVQTDVKKGNDGLGLGLLLRMTRLADLGLGQLCMPEVDFENMLEPH